ncbi:Holliday junction branch migration protein RuvA [Nakamurella endophytica]|uniref:Holliday junction branch migration complex subunit RuvA n=1 Tax=Nakamurella endophytica TaxID=1748367 RepID=A0A917T908_9ACTN|nr:Holliday junction branch migration protein RuvA [Nakamurella endophytica]GGM14065.1 Holliday junction ATP-dependent DNA helicase RuvA [Nakamurella endophytica]
MIASVRGVVASVALDHAVLEVGGVGLAVRATPSTLAGLRRGEQARLATSLVVREDSLTLFGFASDAARELFELVQSVSGVGPKIALALLAVLDPEALRAALASGDTAALTRAPGIGRKGAERLVLELRDKVGPAAAPAGSGTVDEAGGDTGGSVLAWRPQLTEALVGLGFTPKQSEDAVAAVAAGTDDPAVDGGDVGQLLRRALSLLGRSR